jgi:hypothetical protein
MAVAVGDALCCETEPRVGGAVIVPLRSSNGRGVGSPCSNKLANCLCHPGARSGSNQQLLLQASRNFSIATPSAHCVPGCFGQSTLCNCHMLMNVCRKAETSNKATVAPADGQHLASQRRDSPRGPLGHSIAHGGAGTDGWPASEARFLGGQLERRHLNAPSLRSGRRSGLALRANTNT